MSYFNRFHRYHQNDAAAIMVSTFFFLLQFSSLALYFYISSCYSLNYSFIDRQDKKKIRT